ncbi:MAG TPA: hypothetical protein VKU77_38585 [Streptosporangiaceae bacterium]|nr:hypothetical protein [Streptosporangiaceae bacterium]
MTEDGAGDVDGDEDGLPGSEGDGDGCGARERYAVQVTSTAWLADGAAEGATVTPLVSGEE